MPANADGPARQPNFETPIQQQKARAPKAKASLKQKQKVGNIAGGLKKKKASASDLHKGATKA